MQSNRMNGSVRGYLCSAAHAPGCQNDQSQLVFKKLIRVVVKTLEADKIVKAINIYTKRVVTTCDGYTKLSRHIGTPVRFVSRRDDKILQSSKWGILHKKRA